MDSQIYTPKSYVGEFVHLLDDKKRFTVPVRWRHSKDGDEFYFVPGRDSSHLRVMVPAQFDLMSAEVKNNPAIPPRERTIYLRDFHRTAHHAESDKQGRLVIPEDLCRLAGLKEKEEILLNGGPGFFEIWNKSKRAQDERASKEISDRVRDQVGH